MNDALDSDQPLIWQTLPNDCDAAQFDEAERLLRQTEDRSGSAEPDVRDSVQLLLRLIRIARMGGAADGGLQASENLELIASVNSCGAAIEHSVLRPGSSRELTSTLQTARERWAEYLSLLESPEEGDESWQEERWLEPSTADDWDASLDMGVDVDSEPAPLEELASEPTAEQINGILSAIGGGDRAETSVREGALPTAAARLEPPSLETISDEEFAEAFADDASRGVSIMEQALLDYEANGSQDSLTQLCRELHTLKGAAGSVGLAKLAEYLHSVEDVIRSCREQQARLDVDLALRCVDAVRRQIAVLHGENDAVGPAVDLDGAMGAAEMSAAVVKAADDGESARPAASVSTPAVFKELGGSREPTLRVKAAQVDRLMDMLAELVLLRNHRESRLDDFKRVRQEVGACAARARSIDRHSPRADEFRSEPSTEASPSPNNPSPGSASPNPASHSLGEVSDDLRTVAQDLRELCQPMADENELLSRFIRQFRQELIDLRRVPVEGLFRRLQRSIRDAAQVERKEVTLRLTGEQTGIDRNVQEDLYEPLLHLVRNAVSHGIESAEDRLAAGKTESGQVTLHAHGGSNFLVIEVRDDGRGLDYDALRRRGVATGLLQSNQAATREQLAQLIFHPGFSTRESVSEVSGRGVGMDVVATALQRMGSWIDVDSSPGFGTTIRLTIPLRSVIEHVMVFRNEGQLFAVPMQFVFAAGDVDRSASADARRTRPTAFSEVFGRPASKRERTAIPPAATLELGYGLEAPAGDSQGSAETPRLTLLVDEIVGPEEVVMRPLPSLLHHPTFTGVTLAGSGEIVLCFDMQQLLERGRRSASESPAVDDPPARRQTRTVLVVDDSLAARRSLRKSLEILGFEITEVGDGREALRQIQSQRFDCVISDLEMPVLDGLSLLSQVRGDASTAELPFILASSRDDPHFLARARDLNALAYLKKPVTRETLENALKPILLTFALPMNQGDQREPGICWGVRR